MTIAIVPTYDTGARGRAMPGVSHPPDRELSEAELAETMSDLGVNHVFLADFLSAALAHERGGRHLYRSVAERTANPVLRAKYREFGDETEHHVEVLEHVVRTLGGDPRYVSPAARATEFAGKRIVESTYALAGSIDVMTAELVMLDAVLLAEALDHANWTALARIAASLPAGEARDAVESAAREVLDDEDEHLGWAQATRLQLVTMQAEHTVLATAMARGEEMLETVQRWFDR